MRIWTIGFTKKDARTFFGLLAASGAARVADVRLHNTSQLAGFAKQDDLAFFLERICGMAYERVPALAPDEDLLASYRKKRVTWDEYASGYVALLEERGVEESVARELIDGSVLLCSEDKPDRCHRRLAAEYLGRRWGGAEIVHLG